jgi:glycerol-3-phosphate dehydrogenase (NAD(P)+)
MRVTVVGAGSWGTALTILLARNGHEVTLFGRSEDDIESMRALRENQRYLPGFVIPESVAIGTDPQALTPCDFWVVAVPSGGVRDAGALIRSVQPNALVVVASKGLETGTAMLLTEVIIESAPDAEVGAISGPNLAVEIAQGVPTAAVVAFASDKTADRVRSAFMCRSFRVYTSTDIIGVELAGALKNVMAIAAGLSDGLGFGDNTKGALLARGLHEMCLLGMALGARMETFMGIAGVGDLFATAASCLSRNYRVGRAIGSGTSLADAIEQVGQVAEGVPTTEAALTLARRKGLKLPTFEAVETVLREQVRPIEAVGLLMERLPKNEMD